MRARRAASRDRADLRPPAVRPVYGAHAALAIAGSFVASPAPAVGFALVLFAAVSLYLDLNTRLYLIRRLFFRRASQNVVSRGRSPDAPARVVLSAHYDAARTGYVFRAPLRWLNGRSARSRVVLSPFRAFFWGGIVPLLPILGAQMAGFDPGWLADPSCCRRSR